MYLYYIGKNIFSLSKTEHINKDLLVPVGYFLTWYFMKNSTNINLIISQFYCEVYDYHVNVPVCKVYVDLMSNLLHMCDGNAGLVKHSIFHAKYM